MRRRGTPQRKPPAPLEANGLQVKRPDKYTDHRCFVLSAWFSMCSGRCFAISVLDWRYTCTLYKHLSTFTLYKHPSTFTLDIHPQLNSLHVVHRGLRRGAVRLCRGSGLEGGWGCGPLATRAAAAPPVLCSSSLAGHWPYMLCSLHMCVSLHMLCASPHALFSPHCLNQTMRVYSRIEATRASKGSRAK